MIYLMCFHLNYIINFITMLMRLAQMFATAKHLKTERFLELVKPAKGITKLITTEEKAKINQQITKKMDELENTGLSREQILMSRSQKGIPLKLDPFFQFLKNNLKAREIYLKNNDRFTVENVIDIALRQDTGADPSLSRVRGADIVDTKGRANLLHQLKDLREGKFNPQSYDGVNTFTVQKAYDQLKPSQPLRHFFKPLDRYEKREQNLKQVNKYDIHWRNVQLLRQFVTPNGNIKSRYRNYLKDGDQKSVRRAVKTARIMGAMPYFGRTPEPLKRNITSLEDQVQQIGYQHINLQTGHLFQTRSRSMDSLEVQIQKENDLDYKYEKMTGAQKSYKIWVNNLEKVHDQNDVKAEKYARYLKHAQLEESETKKMAHKQDIQNILRGISKYKALRGEEETKVARSGDDECRARFQQEKIEVVQTLKSKNTSKVLEKLLADKLRL